MTSALRRPLARLLHRTVPAWLVRGLGGLMVAAGMSVPWVGKRLGWWGRDAGEVYTGGPASGTLFAAASDLRPALVHVQGGALMMAHVLMAPDTDDRVTLQDGWVSSFVMCATRVTQGQFRAVMDLDPSDCRIGCGDVLPVQSVSWIEATEYLDALSLREGLRPCYTARTEEVLWDPTCDGYRLPTKAQWDYAARVTALNFGDRDDLQRNVWEWVWDATRKEPGRMYLGPARPMDELLDSLVEEPLADPVSRYDDTPTDRLESAGFRCVRDALL